MRRLILSSAALLAAAISLGVIAPSALAEDFPPPAPGDVTWTTTWTPDIASTVNPGTTVTLDATVSDTVAETLTLTAAPTANSAGITVAVTQDGVHYITYDDTQLAAGVPLPVDPSAPTEVQANALAPHAVGPLRIALHLTDRLGGDQGTIAGVWIDSGTVTTPPPVPSTTRECLASYTTTTTTPGAGSNSRPVTVTRTRRVLRGSFPRPVCPTDYPHLYARTAAQLLARAVTAAHQAPGRYAVVITARFASCTVIGDKMTGCAAQSAPRVIDKARRTVAAPPTLAATDRLPPVRCLATVTTRATTPAGATTRTWRADLRHQCTNAGAPTRDAHSVLHVLLGTNPSAGRYAVDITTTYRRCAYWVHTHQLAAPCTAPVAGPASDASQVITPPAPPTTQPSPPTSVDAGRGGMATRDAAPAVRTGTTVGAATGVALALAIFLLGGVAATLRRRSVHNAA